MVSVVSSVFSLNMKISGLRCYQLGKNAMWEKWKDLPTVCVYLFVAKGRKEARLQGEM